MPDRRRQILLAALAIADADGLDAVSMRAVAAKVGVSPMALYPHVGGKEALLDGLAQVERPRDLAALPPNDLVSSPHADTMREAGAFRADC